MSALKMEKVYCNPAHVSSSGQKLKIDRNSRVGNDQVDILSRGNLALVNSRAKSHQDVQCVDRRIDHAVHSDRIEHEIDLENNLTS